MEMGPNGYLVFLFHVHLPLFVHDIQPSMKDLLFFSRLPS